MNFFGAENLITIIVGFIVSTGITQWIKKQTGATAFGAMLLAFAIAFGVAITAVVVNGFVTGQFSWEYLVGQALQIFALSTIAYKALLADAK